MAKVDTAVAVVADGIRSVTMLEEMGNQMDETSRLGDERVDDIQIKGSKGHSP